MGGGSEEAEGEQEVIVDESRECSIDGRSCSSLDGGRDTPNAGAEVSRVEQANRGDHCVDMIVLEEGTPVAFRSRGGSSSRRSFMVNRESEAPLQRRDASSPLSSGIRTTPALDRFHSVQEPFEMPSSDRSHMSSPIRENGFAAFPGHQQFTARSSRFNQPLGWSGYVVRINMLCTASERNS